MKENEKQRIAIFCKKNPAKAIELVQEIANNLQFLTPRHFAQSSGIPERTVYHSITDMEAAKLAVMQMDGVKFIIAKLN